MKIWKRKSEDGKKLYLYWDYGRGPGQRPSTGLFIYTKPQNALERQHNKKTEAQLVVKQGQQILEKQALGTGLNSRT